MMQEVVTDRLKLCAIGRLEHPSLRRQLLVERQVADLHALERLAVQQSLQSQHDAAPRVQLEAVLVRPGSDRVQGEVGPVVGRAWARPRGRTDPVALAPER